MTNRNRLMGLYFVGGRTVANRMECHVAVNTVC